jgi:protein-S-isoprenylcysteine O-methyltransferase Ste14
LAFILGTNSWFSDHIGLLILQIAGLVTGLWSILTMSGSKLNITPIPREGASLVQNGLYKYIRHPMYLSLLMAIPPIVLRSPETVNIIVFLVFLINQFLKMFYEEQLLKHYFKDYSEYMKHSWRLIPFVF